MGKKRIVKKSETSDDKAVKRNSSVSKKKVDYGILHVDCSYNNTKLSFTDGKGNMLCWSSSGSLGFRGAKKGTPFAATKIGEVLGEKAQAMGVKEIGVIVKGVGSGRESAIRSFVSRGINIKFIKDRTPIPHNGPKPPKPRRV